MSVSVFQSWSCIQIELQMFTKGIGKVGFGNARWKSASYSSKTWTSLMAWKDQKEDRVAAA